MRKFIMGTICVFLSVVSYGASAALIDNGTYTTDTESGLDWLDLSVTDGQAYNSATTLNPGWRYATNAEVENIFGLLFEGYYNTDGGFSHSSDGAYADQSIDVDNFISLFGLTGTNSSADLSWGFYEDESMTLRLFGVTDFFDGRTIVYGPNHTPDFDGSRPTGSGLVGNYLVRETVVPIPAAVWLFGSGLIGLIGVARRLKPPEGLIFNQQ